MNKHQRKLAQRYKKKFHYAVLQADKWLESDDPYFQNKGNSDYMNALCEYTEHLIPLFVKNGKFQRNKYARYCERHA